MSSRNRKRKGVKYKMYKKEDDILAAYDLLINFPLQSYDRLQHVIFANYPDGMGFTFFYIMRQVSESKEVGHWVTHEMSLVDDATEERLNEVCEQLQAMKGDVVALNSEEQR